MKNCGILFTNNDKLQTIENRLFGSINGCWNGLQRDSYLSKDTLRRTLYHFLGQASLTSIIHHDNVYLRVDAT